MLIFFNDALRKLTTFSKKLLRLSVITFDFKKLLRFIFYLQNKPNMIEYLTIQGGLLCLMKNKKRICEEK